MRVVHTDRAPSGVGHYSQAIESGGLVFLSGQLPANPASGAVEATDIEGQVAQVMANIAAVLEAAGSSLDRILKVTIFLSDMSLFERMNAAYGQALGDHRPARSTVPVLPLPRGALIEVEVIAEAGAHG